MTLKTYKKIRLVVVVITALIFSQSLILRNFFIPIMVLGLSSLLLLYFRKKVTGVIADERDYQVGGRAALLAIQVTSWIGVIVMFVLYSLGAANPLYQAIAMTLAFSVCALMLIYSALFKYYSKHNFKDGK